VLLLAWTSVALAGPAVVLEPLRRDDLHALLPTAADRPEEVHAWPGDEVGLLSPARAWLGGGTRVGLFAEASAPDAPPLTLWARGVDAAGEVGPWVPVTETWREGATRVGVADLGDWWPGAQLRVADADAARSLGWELLVPLEEQGETEPPTSPPPPLSDGLEELGVVTRTEWGAEPTTCTSTEDDWYRFAIHHTAGTQTYGGTVEGAVRAHQAYSLGTGEYCDIPYQFLVGYDGSLYEGRPLQYRSGATGGDNNDGNIAVCFLGCYSGDACGSLGTDDTDIMIVAARALVDQLAEDHTIGVDEDSLRGHRDWPGNYTNCPGDYIYPRLGEVRAAEAPYTATVLGWSSDADGGTGLRLPRGEDVEVTLEVRNDGTRSWTPGPVGAAGSTFLAPVPRDTTTPYAGGGWPSPTRAAAPGAVVEPGQVGAFTFQLRGDTLGPGSVAFGFVHEQVTWFADLPYGGGPEDGAFSLAFEVVEPTGSDTGGEGPPGSRLPGTPMALDEEGCACGTVPRAERGGVGLVALLALGFVRRRRRREPRARG
jgi:MYXO-CTERM domain-containing protein